MLMKPAQSCVILGFPRTVSQAETLSKHQDIDVVVNLDVPFDTIADRIKVTSLNPLWIWANWEYQ